MPSDSLGFPRISHDPLIGVPVRIPQGTVAVFRIPKDSTGPTRILQDPLGFFCAHIRPLQDSFVLPQDPSGFHRNPWDPK
eukprot:2475468-Pyramimonas_sp.AAC.1